jgi:hypothetical protein
MGLLDQVKNVLAQYTSGAASPQDAAAHFDQVAQAADPATLAQGVSAVMHSDQTPPFAQIVSQLFTSATPDQKTAMLNTLLASAPANLRGEISGMMPGAGGSTAVTATQAASTSSDTVAKIAQRLHDQGPGVVDKMSSFYAQHPTLVKTLGSAAMIIAMRKIAEAHQGS